MQPIEDLELSDVEQILSLNNAHAAETSLLDASGIAALLGNAFYSRGADRGATAFLIALDQNALYDNPNFRWFQQRYETFAYIDRIVVAGFAHGQGLARRLYEDLFAASLQAGHLRVVCEINLEPPNPVSDAFHAAMGFVEVGQAVIHGGTKTVRYFERMLH